MVSHGKVRNWVETSPTPSNRPIAHDIAGVCVAADQEIELPPMPQRAADLRRRAPHELGIVADRLDIAAAAVVGEDAGLEIALLVDPELHHRFKPEAVRGARPQIFALLGGGALVG